MKNFDHYTIRLIADGDAEALFELFDSNRSRLEDFFSGTMAQNKTFADTQNYVASVLKRIEDGVYFPYLIIDTTRNRIAAFIDVKNIDRNLPKAELGNFADKDYQSQGISSRALAIICDYHFNTLGFNKLFIRTHPDNTAACKLAEKTGFKKEGLLRSDYKTTAGAAVDLVYYGRLKGE
ncbi:MAG: GNAT family N-acetyltransferase [Bacteroidetes bacterium]|nr:GNAT family N-acetyltransferase [Bacteroidota bacterium]